MFQKKLFQKLAFYNTFNEKPKIKLFKKHRFTAGASFHDEPNIYEMAEEFCWYARSYKVEIVDSKDPLAQLEASKLSIED